MKLTAALLAMLALCSCGDQGKQVVSVPPPSAPVDVSRPLGKEALPWIKCLQENGSTSLACRSLEPSH